MLALVCRSPGDLTLEERPEPLRRPGDVLVRVRRVGICGTDYHIYEGKHPYLAYPRIMGHELAVEVLEAPPETGLAAGEVMAVNPYLACGACYACRRGRPNCCMKIEVLGVHRDGGMTQLLALPSAGLVRTDGLGPDACAAVEFLAIGAHAVRRARVIPGETALVVGAGPIGLGVAMFARISGAAVTVLDRDAERVALALALTGAAHGIVADDSVDAAIAEASAGDGFGLVFDATGNRHSMEKGFDFVAHGGRYVLVSVVKDPISFADADFHRKEMTLMGSRNATTTDFTAVVEALRSGDVPVGRLITHRTTLRDAVRDLPKWATSKRGLVKAVIEIP